MSFTAKDVAKLREITGAGMMDCKKALTHSNGDMEKASEYLREQGVSVAAKKASRIASEGVVTAFVSDDKHTGVLVEVNCESDFVAKADAFVELASQISKTVADKNPSNDEAALNAKADNGSTVNELITVATAKIGEKLSLRRFVRFSNPKAYQESYIHMGGKIGVLLEVETDSDLSSNEEFVALCHDLSMHIAAMSPTYVYENEVPTAEVEHEMEILKAQALNEGKPLAVVEKMVQGRIKKYFAEVCLHEQEFVKDNTQKVGQVVSALAKKLGVNIKLVKFSRLTMGEGLEKKVDNLADEVAKLSQ